MFASCVSVLCRIRHSCVRKWVLLDRISRTQPPSNTAKYLALLQLTITPAEPSVDHSPASASSHSLFLCTTVLTTHATRIEYLCILAALSYKRSFFLSVELNRIRARAKESGLSRHACLVSRLRLVLYGFGFVRLLITAYSAVDPFSSTSRSVVVTMHR